MSAGNAFPLYFTAASVVAVGGMFYVGYRADKKRNADLATVARTMGFDFLEKCSDGDLAGLGEMQLFNRGHGRKGKRMMTGKLADRPCHILDYQYITGSGKSQHTHMQTVVLFDQAATQLPDFTLSPENVLHRLAEIFGYQDIDFDTFPEFSKHYLLRGKDEAGIRKAFTTDVLTLLGGTTGWSVESCNGHLAVYREGRFTEAAQIPSYAAEGLRIASALKA